MTNTAWRLRLIPEHVSRAMQNRGVASPTALAQLAGVHRNTLLPALSGRDVSGKLVSAVATALCVRPDSISIWERR